LALHYALYLGLVIFGYPEEEVSIGLHERIGPCNQTVPIHTVFGTVSIISSYLFTKKVGSNGDVSDFFLFGGGGRLVSISSVT
jgi:hypothetical protein